MEAVDVPLTIVPNGNSSFRTAVAQAISWLLIAPRSALLDARMGAVHHPLRNSTLPNNCKVRQSFARF